MDIKRLLVVNVPIKNCNLKCEYCYISALQENEKGEASFYIVQNMLGNAFRESAWEELALLI